MSDFVQIEGARPRLPEWLRKPDTHFESVHLLKRGMRQRNLHTVCESARCPNIHECFHRGAATFMILGNLCTRGCGFCSVPKGSPAKKEFTLDAAEPSGLLWRHDDNALVPATPEHDDASREVILTDTVGFIRKLPHHLVASFRATLAEAREADLLLHVIDASHPAWEEHRLVVDGVLADIGAQGTPVVHVFNKIDLLTPETLAGMRERMARLLPDAVFVSSQTEDGARPIADLLLTMARSRKPLTRLRIRASEGRLLADVHARSEVVTRVTDPESGDQLLEARVGPALLHQLEVAGAVVA